MWLLLNVKLPLAGALQLLPDHSWIASVCLIQRCVFAGSAGYSCNRFLQCSKRKTFYKRCTDYNWNNFLLSGDRTIFRGFLPKQPWLASQPKGALACIALYIDKYTGIGTIYDSEMYTCVVLHTFMVSYGILKSHYLQWNPPYSLSCHLFSWSKWNLGLGGLQKWPMPSPESQAGVCWQLGQVVAVHCTSD